MHRLREGPPASQARADVSRLKETDMSKTLIIIAMLAIYTGRVVETTAFLPRGDIAWAKADRR